MVIQFAHLRCLYFPVMSCVLYKKKKKKLNSVYLEFKIAK